MVTALTSGLRASTRAIAASISSSGAMSPRATSSASPSPSYRSYSPNPVIGRSFVGGHSTVESVLTRMGWHLPFDRAGRCLTRGQRALARRPHSAHVHLYLAHALAEQERLADAEAAFERAAALAPHNFVVPLHLAIVRLDAAQHARAREALERAARLAPDNPLVAGYL